MAVLTLEGPAPLLRRTCAPVSWAPAAIDLSGLTWATPFDIAALAVIWTRLEQEGRAPRLMVPDDPDVRAYLVDAGLAEVIPAAWEATGSSRVDPPLVRLARLHGPEEWDELASELIAAAHQVLQDRSLTLRTFEILSELVDNATTHGQSSAGAFVCAQRYSGATSGLPPGIWLGVADGGQGIPRHLRSNPKYSDIDEDQHLIRLARQPWVTGTRDRRGWGLVEVFEGATAVGPSELLIRSGRGVGYFRLRPDTVLYARYQGGMRPAVPGSWLHLRVDAG